MTPPAGAFRSLLRSGAGIAAATAVMNVATYGFTMLSARVLGPRQYGALASLMATLLVIAVLQLGLQATAARRISAEPQHVATIERSILKVTYRASLALGLVLLVGSPLIWVLLRLDSPLTAVLVSLASVPMTVMGGQAGILQGERRWVPLSLLYIAVGVPRLVVGGAMIAWRPTEWSAMIGVTIAALAPVAVGWVALRRAREELPVEAGREAHRARLVIREAFHNSHALFAFFVLSNVDVIVARNVLPPHQAGLYAGGLILAKAVLFLPQFVVVIAFPSMATSGEQRHAVTRSLILVGVVGLLSVAAAKVLPSLALIFVGGAKYADVSSRLWLFALLGTALSMLQLLIYSVLARQARWLVALVWAAVVAVVGLSAWVDTVSGLLRLVTIVDALLLAVLLAFTHHQLPTEPQPEAATKR